METQLDTKEVELTDDVRSFESLYILLREVLGIGIEPCIIFNNSGMAFPEECDLESYSGKSCGKCLGDVLAKQIIFEFGDGVETEH